jgi:GAF domain-containing protein
MTAGAPQLGAGDGGEAADQVAAGHARRAAEMSAVDRLETVRVVAGQLADSGDLEQVLSTMDAAVRDALGAGAVTIGLIDDAQGTMTTLMATGFSERTELLLSRPIILDEDVPAAEVWRTGKPIFWSSLDDRDRDYPKYAGVPSEHESWAVLPLVVTGSVTGVISIGWPERRRFSEVDSALLGVLAQQCAVAVDRARLQKAERAERETLELLAEGTRLMVSALDPAVVVRRLVRLAVPRLAPWCAMYVAERDGLRRVAVDIQGNPELAAELQRQPPIAIDSGSPVAASFRRRETIVVPTVTSELLRTLYSDGEAARMPDLDLDRSWTALVVPVWAAGSVIGVMSLVSSVWRGNPPQEVRFAAEGLAGRAGIALWNARRFERERLTASLLTQALMPNEAPAIAGYDLSARYQPWGGPVAGDWFDVTHLPSGEYLIGIGDAAGHGLQAASLMAQLRSAARGSAFAGSGPGEILNGLGLLTIEDDPENLATAIYSILDTERGELRWASAGHIAPLHAGGGSARYLESAGRPPLGCPVEDAPAEHLLHLGPGEMVVLLTDGVVEQRGADLAERLEVLRALVADHTSETAAAVAGHIMSALCHPPDDDCCVVVLRRE